MSAVSLRIAFVLLALVGVVHAADAPTQTTLYKSVGPDGRTVYGDRPPVDGRAAQTLKFENLPSSPLSPATLAYLEQLKKAGATPPAALPGGELVLFTASWCVYCKQAKAYLGSKGASYKEVDIESNAGAASYVQAGGQRGVPLLFRNGQRVLGFSASAYDAMLSAKN
jgi:glutaredoxin